MPQTLPHAPGMLHDPLPKPAPGPSLAGLLVLTCKLDFHVKIFLGAGGSLGLQLQHHGQHTAHAAIKGTVFIARVTDWFFQLKAAA
jgi:hypothetical protein